MSDDLDPGKFGTGTPFSLGVEEELFLVDPNTGQLRNGIASLFERIEEPARGEVAREVHACQVELITDVCTDVAEAIEVLAGLRRAVLAAGVGIVGSGTHPTAGEGDAEFTDKERYRLIRDLLGDALATPVAALHVHVGMPDAETAIRAFNGLRRHLPLLEALGANSPFRHGRDTGLASAREITLRAWPRPGAPRAMSDYADFAASTSGSPRSPACPTTRFTGGSCGPDPRLGTVELRALDVQPSLAHTAGLVAAVARARHEAESGDPIPGPPPRSSKRPPSAPPGPGSTPPFPMRQGACVPSRSCSRRPSSLCGRARVSSGASRNSLRLFDLMEQGGAAGLQRDAAGDAGDTGAVLTMLLARARDVEASWEP